MRIPWNKGLTKETDKRVLLQSLKVSGNSHYRYGVREERICKCGCEEVFKCTSGSNKMYIKGHFWRNKKRGATWNKGLKGAQIAWNKGLTKETDNRLTHSFEDRIKISNAQMGAKSHLWRGGISYEIYPLGWNKTFKEQIRRRDEYKCQICGRSEVEEIRKLCVHHIDYDKQNIEPENLASLCSSCHTKTNHNREYWKKFFAIKRANAKSIIEINADVDKLLAPIQ